MAGGYHYEKERKSVGGVEYKPMPQKNFSSHICLSGDTMILTLMGEKRLDKIVSGDMVITPYGNRKVLASSLTKRNAKVMEITLSNGKKIVCTPNHEFILANKSIAKCNTLEYTDVLQNYESWRTLKWSIQSLLSFKARSIGFRQAIIIGQKIGGKKELVIFTGLFGKVITSVKSLMDMLSIMLTETLSIMTFSIWHLFMVQTTQDSISRRESKKELLIMDNHCFLREKLPKHGINLQKVVNGIKNTESIHGKIGKCFLSIVNTVAKNFLPHSLLARNFAISIARSEQDTVAESTTFIDRVLFAVKTLQRINIIKSRRVPKIVQISQCLKPEDVYNITVDIDHVFYANGVLVCNCDSLQYLCLYLTEKISYDAARKQFLAQLKQPTYRPGSYDAGY